jgi:hypothetical protein
MHDRASNTETPPSGLLLQLLFQTAVGVRLIQARPPELWDAANQIFITSGLPDFVAFLKFYVHSKNDGQFVIACGSNGNGGLWVAISGVAGLCTL